MGARDGVSKSGRRYPFPGLRGIQVLVWLLVAVNLGLAYAIVFSPSGIWGYRNKRSQVVELEALHAALAGENRRLFHKIQRLRNDPAFQEKMVREELGWVAGDELVFFFLDGAGEVKNRENP